MDLAICLIYYSDRLSQAERSDDLAVITGFNMILYELNCSNGHNFEAWFRDSATYDKQAKRGDVECPVCSDTSIGKAPMAPRLSSSVKKENGEERAKEVAEQILKAVNKIQEHVEENCDYVGDKFADEARAIHYGDADERGIYGEATGEEVSDLIEEEIDVLPLPGRNRKNS